MKNIKKLLSIVMVLAMVLALGASALAAEAPKTQTHKVTVENDPGKNFSAYQIFSGGTAETTDKDGHTGTTLGQVDWGTGVNAEPFLKALKADETIGSKFDGCETAKDVAEVLSTCSEADASIFAQIAYNCRKSISAFIVIDENGKGSVELADGYYLIVENGDTNDNGVINPALLQLTDKGDVTIKQKADVPTVDKSVTDVNDSDGSDPVEGDSADYDIGDDVPYTLTAKLGNGYELYETYYLEFTDKMSKGLTLNRESITITKEDGTDIKEAFAIETSTDETTGETTLTIKVSDLKTAVPDLKSGDKIIVKYTAELNTNAVIGVEGNPNTVTLTYSNDPNNNGEGKPTDTTPPDTVIVFTFDQKVNKIDGTGKALEGAGFTLLKKVASGGSTIKFFEGTANEVSYDGVKKVGEWAADGKTTFDFDGLDDGEYILVESTVPEGYNRAEDIVFKIEATHIDPDTLTDPNGKALTEFNVYVWDKTAGTAGTGDWVKQEPEGAANQKVLGVTMGAPDGMISGTVVNDSGLELPETGGIGTTIFYVVGAILVVGAVILLVTRKRANDATK